MSREFPALAFERYCDDIVVHCFSEKQACYAGRRITERLGGLGLRLHPGKTRIVYCQQDGRDDSYENTSFTFLGYAFRKRTARGMDGSPFNGFLPAVSKDAVKKMSRAVRSWRLHRWTTLSLDELATCSTAGDGLRLAVPGWTARAAHSFRFGPGDRLPGRLRLAGTVARVAFGRFRLAGAAAALRARGRGRTAAA
jgi:hypothetical protein